MAELEPPERFGERPDVADCQVLACPLGPDKLTHNLTASPVAICHFELPRGVGRHSLCGGRPCLNSEAHLKTRVRPALRPPFVPPIVALMDCETLKLHQYLRNSSPVVLVYAVLFAAIENLLVNSDKAPRNSEGHYARLWLPL